MIAFTKLMLSVLGFSAVIIGVMIFIGGPAFTANAFGRLVDGTIGVSIYSGGLENINVDSEMRFFSVFWIAYGVYLLWLARRIRENAARVFVAMGVFFVGGLGRLISFVTLGAPDLLFHVLLYVELGGPIVLATVFGLALRKSD